MKISGSTRSIGKAFMVLLSALVSIYLSSCSSGKTTTIDYSNYINSLNQMGVDKYIGIQPTGETYQNGWESYYYDTASPARCFNGTQYIVSLHRGDPNKVILFLEGGGACWDYNSCYVTDMAKSSDAPLPLSVLFDGLLVTSNPLNPFKDYSVVYAGYCDASLWSGDNDVKYNGVETYFHGLANLSAAVTLMKQNFINPDKILVAGYSAGGEGTFAGYLVTRTQYPFTTLNVINDSGIGVFNPQQPQILQTWMSNWNMGNILPDGCPLCNQHLAYLVNWVLDRDQNVNFGFSSYYEDAILGGEFLQMSGSDYKNAILSVTDHIHSLHPGHFKRFFANGNLHTFIELGSFYTGRIDNTPYYQWAADMMTDTAAWHDLLE